MFTVTGYADGVAYGVAVDADEATDNEDAFGLVTGNPAVLSLLAAHEGDTLDVTPTGPAYRLDRGDPESVLGALHALTEVVEVDGDAPDVLRASREPGTDH